MRVFLDANVLFTAAYSPNGKARFLIDNAGTIGAQLITSDYAWNESERNLIKKKNSALAELEKIKQQIQIVSTIQGSCPIELKEKDVPIYMTSTGHSCTHLLTGDIKDFGKYMNSPESTQGMIIQTVSEFLDSFS